MRTRIVLALLSGMSLFSSSSVFAHVSPSDGGLMSLLHSFTGLHHVPALVLIGIGIAYFIRRQRKTNK